MEKELAEGRFVWIKMPYGDFVIDGARVIVLFAGGTGITAFTAFLDGLTPAFQHKVYLAYGARSSNLLIYRDFVQQRAAMFSQLQPFYFVEQGADGESSARLETVGGLSVAAMWEHIENPLAASYYISGPPLMLKTISRDLIERGIRDDAIQMDAWE
jgi:NAD(P)H-flavin reductase